MIEDQVDVKTPDGTADALFFHEEGEARPGVLFLTDIMGIRDANRGMAKRLAEAGYTVLLPNIFYRTGKPPIFDFPMKMGDERTMKRFQEITGPLTPEAQMKDVGAYIDFLANQPAVTEAKIGVVGYCFTGSTAMRTAAARPERVAAAASFHGGGLWSDQPSSPHHLLPQIKARLYFGHAIEDRSMPAEAIEQLEKVLAEWGGHYESETYDGAHHGWTTPGGQVYNEPQAERAWKKLTELFAATLV
jgi:carboxymethylenebutenolidase